MNNGDKQPGDGRGTPEPDHQKHGLRAVLSSILWAALGVQSNKNRERDFQHGNLKMFITAGIIFTTLFVVTLILVVKFALRNTGL